MTMLLAKDPRQPAEPRSFDDHVSDFRRYGRAYFKAWTDPVLVRVDSDDDDERRMFRTVMVTTTRLASFRSGDPTQLALRAVYPIAKRVGAAFPERIGVGRAPNADVCLPLPRLSKYHAYFSVGPDGVDRLTDADSKNGTGVDGKPLAPAESQKLRDGAQIALGPYAFLFFGPRAFVELVAWRATH